MITFTITNKHRPKATIIMIVSFAGKQYRKSIGVGVPPKLWNDNKKCARITADFDGFAINTAIAEWGRRGEEAIKHFSERKYIPTQAEFSERLMTLEPNQVNEAEPDDGTQYVCTYIEKVFIPRYRFVRGEDTLKVYTTALHKLREYEQAHGRKLQFDNITIDFYNSFQKWFYGRGWSRNYFGNIIKVIKLIHKEARSSDRLHASTGTDHRDFIAPSETADSVYLNTEELAKIHHLTITPALVQDVDHPLSEDNLNKKITSLERARGLFLIGCYTGLRVSDFSRLRDAHIGRYISIKTTKTGASVVIPIHPVVRAIISSGFDLSDTVSDQKLNNQIKVLCRIAGITNEVMVNKNQGGRAVEIVVPKYKLVSSHTARRSFATNAYKAGVPTIAIMKITGHTKESTFLRYIKVSAEENAEILSNHPFFLDAKKMDEQNAHPKE